MSISVNLLAGELYVQAQMMFDNQMYTQLLSVVDLAIKQAIITNENFETEFVSLSCPIFFLFNLKKSTLCKLFFVFTIRSYVLSLPILGDWDSVYYPELDC